MNAETNKPAAPKAGRWRRWWVYAAEAVLFILLLAGVHAWQTRDLPAGPAMPLEGALLDGRPCKASSEAQDHQVFSIAMQSGEDTAVREHMRQRQLSFPVINDAEGVLARRWGIRGVPTSFILDGTGHIRFVEVGYTTEAGLRLRLALAGE